MERVDADSMDAVKMAELQKDVLYTRDMSKETRDMVQGFIEKQAARDTEIRDQVVALKLRSARLEDRVSLLMWIIGGIILTLASTSYQVWVKGVFKL